MLYATCSTAAGTAAKVATLAAGSISLTEGVTVSVTFSNTNTAANPTLNVNGTGAKAIRTNGLASCYWMAGTAVTFTYDGTYWQCCSAAVYGSEAVMGNPSGGNVHIDGDSVDVRDSSTMLATFAKNGAKFGMSNQSAVIEFCDGNAAITSTRQLHETGGTAYDYSNVFKAVRKSDALTTAVMLEVNDTISGMYRRSAVISEELPTMADCAFMVNYGMIGQGMLQLQAGEGVGVTLEMLARNATSGNYTASVDYVALVRFMASASKCGSLASAVDIVASSSYSDWNLQGRCRGNTCCLTVSHGRGSAYVPMPSSGASMLGYIKSAYIPKYNVEFQGITPEGNYWNINIDQTTGAIQLYSNKAAFTEDFPAGFTMSWVV